MTAFHELLESGLPINWTTVEVGWYGPGRNPRQLDAQEVIDYAVAQLMLPRPSESPELFLLAGESCENTESISKLIRRLASNEEGSVNCEIRKWQIVLLRRLLRDLPIDPIEGLMGLSDFWGTFDRPKDCPNIERSHHGISPAEYFTPERYASALEAHKKWIEQEDRALKASS